MGQAAWSTFRKCMATAPIEVDLAEENKNVLFGS